MVLGGYCLFGRLSKFIMKIVGNLLEVLITFFLGFYELYSVFREQIMVFSVSRNFSSQDFRQLLEVSKKRVGIRRTFSLKGSTNSLDDS